MMRGSAFWVSSIFALPSRQPTVGELVSSTMFGAVQNVVPSSLGLMKFHIVVMPEVFDGRRSALTIDPDGCVGDNLGRPRNCNLGKSGQPWPPTRGNAPGLRGSNRRPLETLGDGGVVFDFRARIPPGIGHPCQFGRRHREGGRRL